MINTDDCDLWAGYTDSRGYGHISVKVNGKWTSQTIHRALYEAKHGILSKALVIDHLCRVTRCINLQHLEAVTNQVNIKRGVFKKSQVTHCPKGHEYTEANTILSKRNQRSCRECNRTAHRKWYKNSKISH